MLQAHEGGTGVRLKRLELSGFKTFAERAVLEFSSQITAIVGPNGSGKSNVFDAIRWALGEGSLRSLRGVRTEDIIFAGTERRRPLAMAEVTLTLDNEDASLVLPPGPADDKMLPTPLLFSEVTVTRRGMRNAESQYFINGLPCRLRDIQTMFLGTGLGSHSYALITQGEVEQLLDATPDERRMLLEEAAGLARYKRRRHDAERRMAAADSTLLRVSDILRELEAQAAQLAAQAEAAERYQAQTRELRVLELSLQVEEVRRFQRAQRRVREQLDVVAAHRREIDGAVQALTEQRHALDQRATAAGQESDQIRRAQMDLTERRSAAEATMELIGERLRGLEIQRQRIGRDMARYRAEQDAELCERASMVDAQADLVARLSTAQAEIDAAEAALLRMDQEAADDEARAETSRAEARRIAEARAQTLTEIAAVQAREAGYRERSETLGDRIAHLRGKWDEVRDRRAALAQECAEDEAALRDLRQRTAALRADLEAQTDARESAVATERQLEIDRERLATRLRYLEEAQAQYRGHDVGAREILLAKHTDPSILPGLKGTLADCITVSRELRPAIEAALGPRLSALIVETIEDARAALERLGGEAKGQVTFVPIASLRPDLPPPVPPDVVSDPGTRGLAVDLVQPVGTCAEAVHALLADVLIVSDLDAVLRARANGYAGRVASISGEMVTAQGVLVAGRRVEDYGSLLGRTEEMGEIRAALEAAGTAIGDVQRRTQDMAERIREVEQAIVDTEARAAGQAERLADGRRRLTLTEAETERYAGEATELGAEKTAADENASAQAAVHERLRDLAESAGARLAQAEGQVEAIAADLRRRVGARRAAAAQAGESRIALTELAGRRAALDTRIAEIDRAVGQMVGRCAELSAEEHQLDEDASREDAERQVARARCESLDAERAQLASTQAAIEDERAALAARRLEADAQHREMMDRAAALAEETHRVEVRQAQVEAELGSARRRLEEEFGLPFERAVGAVPDDVNRDETLGQIEALRGLIGAIGPVNLLAIEEHRQVAERAQALRAQMEDVQGAIFALRTLIAQLEEVIRGHFDDTYRAVNEEFSALFERLFGGGRARLELVPAAEGDEPGVDIIAQPPGKKLRSLGALSGGERVMVALALAFAMLRVRPSPFCVFDEVEAALDEANTRKVSEVLRELSQRTQIIIITHNKATMEGSDALFGITMEEAGVSHMVSMRLATPDEPQPVG